MLTLERVFAELVSVSVVAHGVGVPLKLLGPARASVDGCEDDHQDDDPEGYEKGFVVEKLHGGVYDDQPKMVATMWENPMTAAITTSPTPEKKIMSLMCSFMALGC